MDLDLDFNKQPESLEEITLRIMQGDPKAEASIVIAALVSATDSLTLIAQCHLSQLQLDAERVQRKVNADGTLVPK